MHTCCSRFSVLQSFVYPHCTSYPISRLCLNNGEACKCSSSDFLQRTETPCLRPRLPVHPPPTSVPARTLAAMSIFLGLMNNHPVRQLCPFISTFKMSCARLCRPAWSSRGLAFDPTGGGIAMPGGDEPRSYYVGVDVGTGSVRAALVDQRGTLLAFADQPINQWEPQFNHHEQSSEDIWAACCVVSKVWPWPWHSILAHASFPPPLRWVFLVCPSGTRDNVRVTLDTGFAFWELRVCDRDQQSAGI